MTEIARHTWVQCVDDAGCEAFVRKDGCYYVEEIQPAWDSKSQSIVLRSLVLAGIADVAFEPKRFKPLGPGPAREAKVERELEAAR